MKKLFISICLFMGLAQIPAQAQEVFNYVLQSAEKVVNDPLAPFTKAKINQFKITELNYIRRKAFEKEKEVSTKFLDEQAYYMSEFLSLFFKTVLVEKNIPNDVKKKKILMFMDASCSNPLFNDTDKETVNSYIDEGNELTPFCLDTDWIKALAAAKSQLKEE